VMLLLFVGITGVIAMRLAYLSVFAERPASVSAGSGLVPARGDMVDRNGVPLARTIDAWSIAIQPKKLVGNPDEVAQRLAELLPERSAAQYRAMLTSGRNFFYLRRRALPELVAKVNGIGEPAIAFGREAERLYPQTTVAAHVLGWTDIDGHGVAGMERVLDRRLTDPARRAEPVALSIDSRVQAAMESELGAAMTKFNAVGAMGLVLDVHTGELLALASLPSFNPNAVGKGPPEARRNNATLSVYELGSTFKPLTVAAAMESGIVTSMTKRYDATAPLAIGKFHIRDDHPQKRWLNIPEMLVHSSNIVTARVGEELGQRGFETTFRKLGFDQRADIEIYEKGRPLWPSYWGRTTVMTLGYGHGIAITPLHLANAYAALVNGGIWRPATLMRRDRRHIPEGRRVFSAETSAKMRPLLRLVVTDGTGKSANAAGFRVGGKTGTADKAEAGGYNRGARVSTFAGAFPMDDPKYVVVAMLDDPKGTADTYGFATAGWTAAPVVGRVVSRVGPLLGVIPDEKKDVSGLAELQSLLWKPKKPGH
jgi:cell division protein FtsI (penicillin-binding protein 3)